LPNRSSILARIAPPEVPRNDPCPCGSNLRYKHCHGAISAGGPSVPLAAPVVSARAHPQPISLYRPLGGDWAGLSEPERDACGLLMERALAHQLAERFDEAAEAYAAVLSKAPETHDALHMLGTIELRRGDLQEAKRLIVAAMRLRNPYPAIERNLQLVHDAERAAALPGVLHRPTIDLCERALPILVDLALHSRPAQTVHLVRAAAVTAVDPGWLVQRLAALLSFADLQIWAADGLRGDKVAGPPMRRIDAELALFPRGGCHIFVGIDINDIEWVSRADAERVIVICPPAPPAQLLEQLRALSGDGARKLDLVFPSRAMALRFGTGHTVLAPPVALRANPPALNRARDSARARLAGLQVGGVGRNWRGEAPTAEGQLLQDVVASAGTLVLYDAGLLRYTLGGNASVRFRERSENGLEAFLDSLDCLLLGAEPWWREGDGRELFTAMASGVPVLCPAASIYAEYITNGVDGLLYDSPEDAVRQLVDLRRSPARIAWLGWAARAKLARLIASAPAAGIVRQLVTGRAIASYRDYAEPTRREAIA
jgi:tetratricopeptide (TPR) repeat protein